VDLVFFTHKVDFVSDEERREHVKKCALDLGGLELMKPNRPGELSAPIYKKYRICHLKKASVHYNTVYYINLN
jgi:hypothetical protein